MFQPPLAVVETLGQSLVLKILDLSDAFLSLSWSHELAVVARRNVAPYIPPLIVMPSRKHMTEQQVLSVKLRDIREFGKVDPIAVGKSSAL